MDDVGLVQAVFDLTGLGFGNSLRHVGGHGTSLGRGHQATGAQDFTQTANHAHHIRGSNDHVEIHPAFALDLLHIFVASGEVCASSQSSVYVVALAESQNPNGFTGAVRQNHGAANLLVSVTRVNAQTDVELYGFVELCLRGVAHHLYSVFYFIQLVALNGLSACYISFTMFH